MCPENGPFEAFLIKLHSSQQPGEIILLHLTLSKSFFPLFALRSASNKNEDNLKLLPNHLKFIHFPSARSHTNSWETHRAGLRLPGSVCGCRLPRSCGSRCHRIYTLLAEDFGSPRAQKSSAPPSPTPLPFTCAAAERSRGESRAEQRRGRSPFDSRTRRLVCSYTPTRGGSVSSQRRLWQRRRWLSE